MSTTDQACSECGARLAPGAERCDLCGYPVQEAAPMQEQTGMAEAAATDRPQTQGVYCNQCGWANPPGARFCSMCGERLQEVAAASGQPVRVVSPGAGAPRTVSDRLPDMVSEGVLVDQARDEQRAMTRQVGIIVGAGLLLVVVLFLVTAVSKDLSSGQASSGTIATQATPPATTTEVAPLGPGLIEDVEQLEAEIEQLNGEARQAKQRELVNVFFGAGRLDRAALAQQDLAAATNSQVDWKRTGDLFYDWMMTVEGQAKVEAAQQAVGAYQRVLQADPDNLDVRTDMATAYLSSNNPMQGVQEILRVLEADSTHLQARFNYGIMLAMIGRTDKAIEQFELVKTQVGEESPFFQQAEDAIRSIQAGATP